MLKKILALAFAAMMLLSFATGCKDKGKTKGNSSKKPTSSTGTESVPEDTVSSAIAGVESDMSGDESSIADDESSSHPYEWTIETASAFFRDTDEAKESVTVGNTIKQYKNKHTYQIGAYMLQMQWLQSYGTDRESKKKEYTDAVKSGYFNTYLIGDGGYLEDMLPIIAESGGSFWMSFGRFENNRPTARQEYIKKVQGYLDLFEQYGVLDLLHGAYWDEPIWTGMKNENLAEQMRINYQVFGLRNFPIFACGEFSSDEGNSEALGGVTADEMRKVLPETCKYATDIAFDSYNVDVRDGARYSEEDLKKWNEATNNVLERKFGRKIQNGKDYYIAYKEHLLEYIGHPATFYYFPCAYSANPQGGLVSGGADEAYCTAHLEWMAEDLLNDDRGGGVYMYVWGRGDGNGVSLPKVVVMEDEYGYPMMHPEFEKWPIYSEALRTVRKKFDEAKQNHVYVEPKN